MIANETTLNKKPNETMCHRTAVNKALTAQSATKGLELTDVKQFKREN